MEGKIDTRNVGSAFDLLGKSWELVKANIGLFLLVNILVILGSLTSIIPPTDSGKTEDQLLDTNAIISSTTGISREFIEDFGGALLTAFAVFILVYIYFLVAQTVAVTRVSGGQKPAASQILRESLQKFISVVVTYILSGIIIVSGLILLIVPGIIALKRLIYAPYMVIDKNIGPMQALKESNNLSKKFSGETWAVFGVFILISLLSSILGAIPYIGSLIGTAVAIAFSLLVALRYFQLKDLDKSIPSSAAFDDTASAPPPAVE